MTFLSILCLTLPCCLVMCLAHDETGEAEDEDTAADDGETQVVEHHGSLDIYSPAMISMAVRRPSSAFK